MEKKTETFILAAVGTIALLDLIWRKIGQNKLAVATAAAPVATTANPWDAAMGGTAGIVASQSPAQPFQSAINVTVNPNVAQFLTHNYIPLFGFVGMGGNGTGPVTVH